MCSGIRIGILGELHPTVTERFDLRHRPATVFEIYLDSLLTLPARSGRNFRSLTVSRRPTATWRWSLPMMCRPAKCREILDRHRLVERVELFDVYSETTWNRAPGPWRFTSISSLRSGPLPRKRLTAPWTACCAPCSGRWVRSCETRAPAIRMAAIPCPGSALNKDRLCRRPITVITAMTNTPATGRHHHRRP